MKYIFAILVVLGSLSGTVTLADPNNSSSDWSSPSSNLTMRISGGGHIVVQSGTRDFYLKCEIRNIGTEPVPVYQDARIYLVDDAGQTNRCLKYTDGVRYTPVLAPGESTLWWQNGKIPPEGDFQAFIRHAENSELCSPLIPITLSHSSLSEEESTSLRNEVLQKHFAEYPVLTPNTDSEQAAYTTITFTNNPLVVEGLLYQAFSFTAPELPGDLVWSFVLEDTDHNNVNFYIVPEHGSMQGFTYFHTRRFHHDISGIGKTGDALLFQRLEHKFLNPGQCYFIWFQSMYRDIPSVTLSLNILNDNQSTRDVFIDVYDKVR